MFSQAQLKQLVFEYVPYLLFITLFSWISAQQDNSSELAKSMFTNTVLVSLMLLSKWRGLSKNCNKSASAWFLLAFIGIPLCFIQLNLVFSFPSYMVNHKSAFFLWLIVIELFIRLSRYYASYEFSKLKHKVETMDYVVLSIVVFFSVLWALLFNSIDDPLNNQPIHIFFDIPRNVLRFDEFLSYFTQLFAFYTCGFVLYWVNHHVLINKVLTKFGVFHYVWVATVFTLIASPTLSQLALLLPINSYEFTLLPSGNQDPFDPWNLRIAITIMVISTPIILAFKWQQQATELAQLKQQSAQAELKWLQQQINPHFLFNTLNNLYSLTLAKSDQAPESILQLSNLLRFVVYKGGQGKVTLAEEIDYLTNYLALQQIRVNNRANIELKLPSAIAENNHVHIAPLLLIVLLENAFKHGVDATDQSAWLKAELVLQDNTLRFSCTNSIDIRQSAEQQAGGVGLDNLRRRLELVYPHKHQLVINKKPEMFSVELVLEVDNGKENNHD